MKEIPGSGQVVDPVIAADVPVQCGGLKAQSELTRLNTPRTR
jgi:hypothetical protein